MTVLSFCHSSGFGSSLSGFIIYFITVYVHKLEPAQFKVVGPDHPVTAIVGEEIVLPCHLSPRMSAEKMEMTWFRSQISPFVHHYSDGKDQYGLQMPEFQGRTELLKDGLLNGSVALRILSIRPSDEGQYHCLVLDGIFYEEALLDLKVAGLGSVPLISVERHQDGGIWVVCQSADWYPEAEVLWRDLSGRHLPSFSETTSQGENSLFETETALIVTELSNQKLSCCIRNTVLNQEKESAVYIAGQSPSKPHTELIQFRVMGPGHPVTAVVGETIVLPCHLSPRMSAENMEVRWFRSDFLSFVHLYQHGKDQYRNQMPDYRGRTELLKAGITDGNVSLQILNIRHSDEGQYNCFVQDGSFYEEALLELKIAALGSNPLISVESHQDGGIRVVCQSAGWYPEPKVLWRDPSGQELPSLSEAKSLGDSGLFETENSIIIKERSNQNLSCWVRNTFLNQEKESTVYIAGQLPAKPARLNHLNQKQNKT
uniref:Ig-like domain-containing protein n=1 Tax=Chelonoidis abingdonii TaxID=106734 RepID=A0A8C0H031_CHEAB